MRVTNTALISLLLAGGANAFAPELSGLMAGFAPEYPGRMLLGGRESILDMAGSYLDHLGKPSFSSSETAPAGPKTSYMYTNKKVAGQGNAGVSSGSYLSNMGAQPPLGGAVALPPPPPPVVVSVPPPAAQSVGTDKSQQVASGGDYMNSLSKQPASFAKPAGGFVYKGVPKTGAASKPGVSTGNYLDNMLASASGAAPVAAAAPAALTPPPAESEPVAPAGEAAWAVANPSSYLDAMGSGAGSSGALKRSGGYVYKPTGVTGGKQGPTGYLDNVSGAAATAPAEGTKGYLDNMGGASAGAKREGGYVYSPTGTGQKKAPSSDSYLDNVGSAPLAQAEGAPPAPLAPAMQSAVAPQDVAPAVRAPAKYEAHGAAPGGLNPLTGTIERPTAGWIPVPRPGGGTPSPPNPFSGQGDRPSWNENPVQREISGTPTAPNALSGQGERPSAIGAGPVSREIGGTPVSANALSGQADRPSADSDPSQPRPHGVPQSPNALSGNGPRLSEPQEGLNNVLNMVGSAASESVSPTNSWLSRDQSVAIGGASTPASLVGRPIATTARPSAALRAPGSIYGQTPEPSAPVQATSAPEIPRPSAPANAGGLNNVANMDSAYPSLTSGIAPIQNPSWDGVVEEQAKEAAPMSAVAALTRSQPDFLDAFGTGNRSTLQANPESASSSKPGQQPSFVFPLQVNSADF
jgi:hypothetical protein